MVTPLSAAPEQRELSTGLIIAGAYADKVRKTLFAQLKDLVKQDKEFAREVARATAELNVVLYNILVNELRVDKGDVVRARISYVVEPSKRVKWLYETLRLEVFKRVPDENVARVVSRMVSEKLTQILESFRRAPAEVEAAVRAFEAPEEEERAPPPPPTPPTPPPAPPVAVVEDVVSHIGSADLIGETVEGGYLIKFASKEGASMGLASVSPSGDEVVIDAVVIYGDKCFRYIVRSKGRREDYEKNPEKVLSDMKKVKPFEISKEQALSLVREKMQSLV